MRGLVPEAAGRPGVVVIRVPSDSRKSPRRRRRAVSIVCRYILMYAMSIRRMNPTDFDGHPKSQEDSTCP